MIIAFPIPPDLAAQVLRRDKTLAADIVRRLLAPLPTLRPFQWVIANVCFNEPENKGAFVPEGRWYMEEVVNNADLVDIRDMTLCWGTGNGKTVVCMCIVVWAFSNDQFRGLWVMPSLEGAGGATEFNTTRLTPMIEAMPCFADDLPTGTERHNFAGAWLRFAGNIINFVGSNAPGQVGANRCRIVVKDEEDKFKSFLVRDADTGEYREAGAAYLADERTKQVPRAKRIGCSSPTTESGPIWKDLMASDLRRRWLPCPHCNQTVSGLNSASPWKGWFVLVQSAQYCVLPSKLEDGTEIPYACMTWDKEATRADGSTDVDRLVKSARFQCPHCDGHVRDNHRPWLDKNGLWVPTVPGVKNHRGYHLPSFYAPWTGKDFDSSWGGMAKKFKDALDQGEIGGFINSDLAEVNAAQQHTSKEVIEISSGAERASSEIWVPLASFDHQQNWPYFWFVVRSFLASIFRPPRTVGHRLEFLAALGGEKKALLTSGDESGQAILDRLSCSDHWEPIVRALSADGATGPKLVTTLKEEFDGDLHRLVEHYDKILKLGIGRQGDSELLEAGFCDVWPDVEEVQARHRVRNSDVIVDARFGQVGNHQEVYIECFRRCPQNGFYFWLPGASGGKSLRAPMPGAKPVAAMGWTPCEGWQRGKRWRNKLGIGLPYTLERDDPYKGTVDANKSLIEVFRFDADWALSEMARIRKKNQFTISPRCAWFPQQGDGRGGAMSADEYQKHLRGYYFDAAKGGWDAPAKKGGRQAKERPNHLYDCEKNAVAYAAEKGIFRYLKSTTTKG